MDNNNDVRSYTTVGVTLELLFDASKLVDEVGDFEDLLERTVHRALADFQAEGVFGVMPRGTMGYDNGDEIPSYPRPQGWPEMSLFRAGKTG